MSFTYRAVDRSRDPQEAADWQERIDAWPVIHAYKDHAARFLPPEGAVLDVGCGPGGDLLALGVDRTVGVDPSGIMCGPRAARGARVVRGDGLALPFAPDSFGACRADRVLQHVDDPVAVLRELVRVTGPGGWVVLADPDQESLTIHVEGVPPALTDRVKALRRDIGYRNGRLASRVPGFLRDLGLGDVSIRGFPLVLTDPADAFGVATWPRHWSERGLARFDADEIGLWEQAIARGRGFLYAVSYFVTAGRRVV